MHFFECLQRYHPDGYNVGINVNEAAGQSVFHVHMHLIPRYKGDVPNPKGGVRGVIPSKQSYDANEGFSSPAQPERKKAYTIEEKRNEHGNAYIPWEEEADKLLCRLYDEGNSISVLAEMFERTKGAIRSRLKKCKHSVNHVFSSPTSIINFTSKKPSYDDTRRSSRDNELLQRAQSDL